MSIRALFDANPFFQAIKARDAFCATHSVTLQHWQQLDAASGWCEQRWKDYRLHYRRRVRVEQREATFEFRDFDHAVEFLFRFGVRCATI
jgi:hypothetical protein